MQFPAMKFKGEQKKRVLPKKGYHDARLKVIADLGTVNPPDDKPDWSARRMMMWLFELVNLSTKAKPVWVQMRVPCDKNAKRLKEILTEWLGCTPLEIKKMEVQELLNEPASINIIHSKDKKWANVKDVTEPDGKVKNGFMAPLCVTLHPDEFDEAQFKKLPEWIQNLMIESDEFMEVTGETRRRRNKPAKKKSRRG